MQNPTNVNGLHKFAAKFASANDYDISAPCIFAPCRVGTSGREKNKKPPVRGFSYTTMSATSEDLLNYTEMSCVGLILTDRFVAIDSDDRGSIDFIEALESILGKLPPTFHISSAPGEREGRIFEIPLAYRGQIVKQKILHTEFRHGREYQIIAGNHPLREYEHLTDIWQATVLPDSWCKFLSTKNVGSYENILLNQRNLQSDILTISDNTDDLLTIAVNDKSLVASDPVNSELTGSNSNSNNSHKRILDQSSIGSTFSTATDSQIESKLNDFCTMFQFLQYCNAVEVDLSSRDNRFRLGAILHDIDASDAGLSYCLAVWQLDPSYDYDKSLSVWNSYSDRIGGATLGSVKFWFAREFTKLETKIANTATEDINVNDKQELEDKRKIFNRIQKDKPSLDEFYAYVYYELHDAHNIEFDYDQVIRQYVTGTHLKYLDIEVGYEKYERKHAINRIKQNEYLDRLLSDNGLDSTKIATDILLQLPHGELILKMLNDKNYDAFLGLIIYVTAASSCLPKKRRYKFTPEPVGSTLFTLIDSESGLGKSPFIYEFTGVLKDLENLARDTDKANKNELMKWLEVWDQTTKEERKTLPIPVKFGGKEINHNSAFDEYGITGEDDSGLDASALFLKNFVGKPKAAKSERAWIYISGSPEALRDLNAGQDDNRILWIIDEFSNIYNLTQSYNGAKSKTNNNEIIIGIHNEDQINARKVKQNGISNDIYGEYATSILGGIQPEILKKMAMLEDSQGATARMILLDGSNLLYDPEFCEDSFTPECRVQMSKLYQNMAQLAIADVKPSREGFYIWKAFHVTQVNLSFMCDSPGFKYWLRKISKNVLKIAGIMQDMINAGNGNFNKTTIDDSVIEMAVQIGNVLVSQHAKLFQNTICSEADIDRLSGIDISMSEHQLFIIEYLKKRGKAATMNQITHHGHFKNRKMKTKEVKQIIEPLIGIKLDFIPGEGYILLT